jgi:hypothetical protein
VSLYGFRLAKSLSETEASVAELKDQTASRTEGARKRTARQEHELTAIRKAANDDLEAMRGEPKLQSVRTPRKS